MEFVGYLWRTIAVILSLSPFLGLLYLTKLYVSYLFSIQRDPPTDRPNVKVWNARILILIPFVLTAKLFFFPFLFFIRPEWTASFIEMFLYMGWGGFVVMAYIFFYRRAVTKSPLRYRDYNDLLIFLKKYPRDSKAPVSKYIWEIYLEPVVRMIEKKAYAIAKKITLFSVPDVSAMTISDEVKILSSIRALGRYGDFYNKPFKITVKDMTRHVHVLAPTGSGKTKSLLAPLMQQVIDKGIGFVSIDPKGDTEVMNSILGMLSEQGRLKDLRFFDLAYPERSHTYNPLATNDPETCKSIINATMPDPTGSDRYYIEKQQEFINALMSWMNVYQQAIKEEGGKPLKFNFIDLYVIVAYLPKSIDLLMSKINISRIKDNLIKEWINGVKQEAESNKNYASGVLSGLRKHLARYAFLANAQWLINDYNPDINVSKDLDGGKAISFFLRALKYPAGESFDIGKMLLLDIQGYAARNQEKGISKPLPNILFIDEAASILPRAFLRMFEMARSAGVGIVIAHQDKNQFKPEVFDNIFNNASTKIMLRAGDAETAEFFSRLFGEKTEYKHTYGTSGYNIFDSPKEWLLPHWTSMAREERERIVTPTELLDVPIGESFVYTNTSKGTILARGKTYFFAKEYGAINVENLFPINEERLKKWKEGGMNLIYEFSLSDLEKMDGVDESEYESAKATMKALAGDFNEDKVLGGLPIEDDSSGYAGIDIPTMMVAGDGDVTDIDLVER